ncbi:MAG: hypothetical protein ACXADY_24705 [Candidatus Hodarchaeales archaeon]|jgi:DNA-binding MarR family transcriptional regulator
MEKDNENEINNIQFSNRNEELNRVLTEVFKVDTRFSIITALHMYGSLNLKTLSKLLQRTESTIFHHLTEIQKFTPRIIEIDQEKTSSNRGKFFRLTEITREYYRKSDSLEVFENEIPAIFKKWSGIPVENVTQEMFDALKKQPNLGQMVQSTRRSLSYHHCIENFILSNFEKVENAVKNDLIPERKDFPFGGYTLLSIALKISSPKHSLRIAELITDFFAKLHRLKTEITTEMDERGIKQEDMITEHYYFFGGAVNEFNFTKREN